MKFNSFFLYGALSAVAVAAIGWSVWSTKAIAQDVESPVVPADAVNPDDDSATVVPPVSDPTGSELKPIPSNRASQLEPAATLQSAQSRTNPYSQQPGTGIGLPGPPVYHDPNRSGVPLPLQAGTYSVQVRETDVEAAKRIEAYQQLQNDINNLLQRRHEPKSDSQWSELRQQIVEATAKQFDLRQQLREREIEQLKERLAEVESTVASRNKLKSEIVEKRVADILREPDQLQWESFRFGFAPNIVPIPPRTTGFEPVRVIPIPDDTPPRSADPSVASTASDYQRQFNSVSLSVAEAAARVRIAQQGRDLLFEQYKHGLVGTREMQSLEGELEVAKLIHARTQAEYEGRTKLLVLDVRQAESVYEQALVVLAETQEFNKRSPNSIPSTQVAAQKAAVEQSLIELERAKTLLEIHQKSNAPQDKLPGPDLKDE